MTGRTTFGAELRRRRQLAGLSLGELAKNIHYSKGYLSKIESGDKTANPTIARLCDAAVNAGGALVTMVAEQPAPRPEEQDTGRGTEPWLLQLAPDGVTQFSRSGMAGLDDTTAFLPSPGHSRFPSDPAALCALFTARLDQDRSLGQLVSPAFLLPTLITETHLLRGIAAGTDDGAERLWRLAAQFAEFTGWTVQDAGDDRQAMWWTGTAVELARRGGDRSMEAYAMMRRADMALYSDDPWGTINLARQAQAHPAATARVRGLSALREAQGHALLGADRECFDALGRSGELLDEAAQEPTGGPVLGPTRTPDLGAMVRGWCLFDLGRPGEAAALLESSIGGFAAGASRARVRYGLRAALAQAVAGEVERACEIVEWLAPDLGQSDPATARHDLRLIYRELRRRVAVSRARDVLPVLADLLRSPTTAESA
ncbi:MAG TPA: helix-turn-helix transcriptional regulator [Pseudonocardiaceae bacterium]|nr:helix-turn-helix transcriptional regulator [Pseudonocardiaceae bacterium]